MTIAGPSIAKPPAWRWIGDAVWRIEHAFERAKVEGRAADDVRVRMVFILALFIAGFVSLAVGATRAAVFPSHGRTSWSASLPPGSRADLVDRNGQLLAIDLTVYSLYVDPSLIWNKDETRRVLGALIPADDRERLDRALEGNKRLKVFGPFSSDVRDAIDGYGLPGVSFEPEAGRSYPRGDMAAHLIGFSGADGVGLSGAELALDDQLRAQSGKGPVALSLDLRVQGALEDELRTTLLRHNAAGAVGIVTNVRTGEILAMASLPDAAPDKMAQSPADERLNRAATSVYEMGSTFKIFSLAMGLDSGKVTLDNRYDVATPLHIRGQTIHDSHSETGTYSLREVFIHSSNIGTARMALDVGAQTMQPYFENFGLTRAAPIELKESARPLAPTKWTEQVVANTAFGHGIAVTPLSLAAGAGAIMNGGKYVPLTILRRDTAPAPLRQVVSEHTSRTMIDLMRDNAVNGTGRNADITAPGYRVGGKTGTAEKPMNGTYARNTLVSSFAAVFPTDAPIGADRYLVLIIVDEPHTSSEAPGRPTGAIVSAPTAGRVINRIAPFLGVARGVDTRPPTILASEETGESEQ